MLKKYKVIGLMSGTSLDGVDLAYCEFEYVNKWKYDIIFTRTYSYSQKWIDFLSNINDVNEKYIDVVHRDLGEYYGQLIHKFCQEFHLVPDFIASHGHTVYHKPEEGITLQIGSAERISQQTHLTVINDFRSNDIKLGGQGAPLVPIGDMLLFDKYDYCLNLGGISNISFKKEDNMIAYDICPVNMVLNALSKKLGKEYDDKGNLARSGEVDLALLEKLNKIDYYNLLPPKSLGREWYEDVFSKVFFEHVLSTRDYLRTVVEHIAIQISRVLEGNKKKQVLITGGGAHNEFLIERIRSLSGVKIIIPDKKLIDYKEAMIFAFLGVLRMENKINVLKSVTGASKDHCSGVINNP